MFDATKHLDEIDEPLSRDWRGRCVRREERHRAIICGFDSLPLNREGCEAWAENEEFARREIKAFIQRNRVSYGCGFLVSILAGVIARLIFEWLRRRIWPEREGR